MGKAAARLGGCWAADVAVGRKIGHCLSVMPMRWNPPGLLCYSRPASCQDLPSVAIDGAMTISTECISRMVRTPSAAID